MIRAGRFAILMAPLLLAGCTTTYYERQDEVVRLRADVTRLNNELGLLQSRVSELSATQEHSRQQVADVRGEQVQNQRQLNERLAVVERSVQAQAAEQQRMRTEIVQEISGKVAGLVRSSTPAPPPVRSERGYEHVVKPGETLSAIAAAYGTKVDVIIRANGLKNDVIRVGQKVFIPE